jgi:metacaspase-1
MSGRSLHIGLNRVDPAHYNGWDGALNACEFDANDMETLAKSRGFETSKLLTKEATSGAIIAAIEDAAGRLGPGDIFFCSYSGHGGQVPDKNAEDEPDRSDETWLAFDRQIVDDELYALWGKFRPGVRIIVLSDSCHSGTVLKNIDAEVPNPVATREAAANESPRYRAMPRDVMVATYRAHEDLYDGIQSSVVTAPKADIGATVLLISGCQDDQLSLDGFSNGLFTENLRTVWDDGAWHGGYPAFHQAILARMPSRQQPNYFRVGAADDQFEQQDPFTVS